MEQTKLLGRNGSLCYYDPAAGRLSRGELTWFEGVLPVECNWTVSFFTHGVHPSFHPSSASLVLVLVLWVRGSMRFPCLWEVLMSWTIFLVFFFFFFSFFFGHCRSWWWRSSRLLLACREISWVHMNKAVGTLEWIFIKSLDYRILLDKWTFVTFHWNVTLGNATEQEF